MGVFDWLRGKPRDTQEERAEIRREASTGESVDDRRQSPEEIEAQAEVSRDKEALRHSGI